MSKQNTRATIDANIKQNGQQLITGQILNSVLNTMVTDYAEQAETTEKLTDLERKVGVNVTASIATTAAYAQRNIDVNIASGDFFGVTINASCKITKIPSWVQLEQGRMFVAGTYYFIADENITQLRFTDNTEELSVIISKGMEVKSDYLFDKDADTDFAYFASQIGEVRTIPQSAVIAKGVDNNGYLVTSTNRIATEDIMSGNAMFASIKVGKYNVIWYKNGKKIGETGWRRNATREIVKNEDANGFRIVLAKADDTNLNLSYLPTMVFSCSYASREGYMVKSGILSATTNVPCVIKAGHAFRVTIDIYSAISKICGADWISLTNSSKVAPNSYLFSTDRDIDYIRFVDFSGNLQYAIEYGEEIDALFATKKTIELDGEASNEDKFRYILPYDSSYMGMGRYLSSRNLRNQINTPIVDETLSSADKLFNTAGKLVSSGNYLYILKSQNDVLGASIESKYQYLVRLDTSNNTTSKIKVFDTSVPLSIGGTSYNVADFIEGCIAVINGKIVVSSWAYITSDTTKSCLVTKVVNASTLAVESTNICRLTADGVTNGFINSFLTTTIIGQDRQYCAVFNSGISLYNGYYYGVAKFTNLVILKSPDLINWTLEKVLDGDGMFGEVGIDINAQGIAHLAYRFAYNNLIYQHKIVKCSVTDWKEIDSAYIKGDCSMSTLFRYDGKLYLLSPGDDPLMTLVSNSEGRRAYNITFIDEKYLEHSRILMDTNGVILGPNTNIVENGGSLYACMTGVNLKVVKFVPKIYTIDEVNAVMDGILS